MLLRDSCSGTYPIADISQLVQSLAYNVFNVNPVVDFAILYNAIMIAMAKFTTRSSI
jgi:hypothetical protein